MACRPNFFHNATLSAELRSVRWISVQAWIRYYCLPKKHICCPKARLHMLRWNLKTYCTPSSIKNWVFHIILNKILFLDISLCDNSKEMPRLCCLKLFSSGDILMINNKGTTINPQATFLRNKFSKTRTDQTLFSAEYTLDCSRPLSRQRSW